MVIVLLDTDAKQNLYPLAQTKAVADVRCGIFSVKERWEAITGLNVYVLAEKYLSGLYEAIPDDEYLVIDAMLKDDDDIRLQILSLQTGEALYDEQGIVAGRTTVNISEFNATGSTSYFKKIIPVRSIQRMQYPWQLILWNDEQLRRDFLLLFARSTTQTISDTNKVIQPENLIIEEGAVVEHCIINASTGPVYIGKKATIMEGSVLRGPIAICEGAVIKMGAKIYGATTIGPYCTVGGEVKNSLLQCHSNKAHDGYLGNAVIDWWCNLGAGTSNSNVKNTGGEINVLHESSGKNINVGRKFGMIVGDYNRTAINTSLNSGSIIGICNNIFGEGLMPKTIGDFRWGIHHTSNYKFDKAIEHISNWKKMHGLELSSAEISVLKYIFERRL
jgi:UDP-N-acetylglucosamine diphosphorylase / glucose-1-phosphate thymidylyltransferase / UDP-N-acetylgalactosamine diphosphorylase / glucosamine-1-phosphate N-acetyltransferase / galactosamine-1-phosphate N-acetyltransferase